MRSSLAPPARPPGIVVNPPPPHATSLKHWRAFGADEWNHVRHGAVGLALGSLLPVVLFYVSYRLWSFTHAVALVLAWSAALYVWHRRRAGLSDVFSATTFAFACLKASAGLVSQNPTLYLGWPSLENVIYGTVFFGSAAIGRPVLALYAQRLYPVPPAVRASGPFRRAFLVVSAVWLVGNLLRGVVRLLLLATLPMELFLIADTVAGWPINATLVGFTAWYPIRELRRAGLVTQEPDVVHSIEKAVDEPVAGVP